MIFKYCRKCFGIRQFRGLTPRHCDVCGGDE